MRLYLYTSVVIKYLYNGVESHNCPYFNAEIDVTENMTMLDIMLRVRMLCCSGLREKERLETKRGKKCILTIQGSLFFYVVAISRTQAIYKTIRRTFSEYGTHVSSNTFPVL